MNLTPRAKQVKPSSAPAEMKKEKFPRLPQVLTCDCGKSIKVSRYRIRDGYKCHACRFPSN